MNKPKQDNIIDNLGELFLSVIFDTYGVTIIFKAKVIAVKIDISNIDMSFDFSHTGQNGMCNPIKANRQK